MKDPFSLLGLPRRPYLNKEEIGIAYRRLAGKLHPDQTGGDAAAFRELGEAAAILRDPAKRLRELAGSSSSNHLPSKAAELFPKVVEVLQQSDKLLAQSSATTNTLSKALLASPLRLQRTELRETLLIVNQWRASLDQQLVRMDEDWHPKNINDLKPLADSFAYAERWETQLRERELALESILG